MKSYFRIQASPPPPGGGVSFMLCSVSAIRVLLQIDQAHNSMIFVCFFCFFLNEGLIVHHIYILCVT